jgi:hypothetical protein
VDKTLDKGWTTLCQGTGQTVAKAKEKAGSLAGFASLHFVLAFNSIMSANSRLTHTFFALCEVFAVRCMHR